MATTCTMAHRVDQSAIIVLSFTLRHVPYALIHTLFGMASL
jgi:hypothetical protein